MPGKILQQQPRSARGWIPAALVLLIAPWAAARATPAQDATDRQWLQEMKQTERGPFSAIRWFCTDGARIAPRDGNCAQHGGGVQHGQWSERTLDLRARGYLVGNLLVTLDPQLIAEPLADPAAIPQILVERFLVGYDDGWIFRGGRSYQGALQADDETPAGRALLLALVASDAPFLLTREAARLLPHTGATKLLGRVRELAAALDLRDPRFHALRSRIHNSPQAGDAALVRAAALRAAGDAELSADYETLAGAIDEAFQARPLAQSLTRVARRVREPGLQALAAQFEAADQPEAQLIAAAQAVSWLRDHLNAFATPELKLAALDTSLEAEAAVMIAGANLQTGLSQVSRHQRLQWLGTLGSALYGAGLLSPREHAALGAALGALPAGTVTLADYRDRLEYLARVPQWCSRRIDYELGDGIDRLAAIEPLARLYAGDRVRGSPLLFYSQILQSLRDDADRMAQARHSLFGKPAGGQLRRLNPGLARGVLRTTMQTDGTPAIYVVPATTADLPAAAGIITEDEGNPLSHVQLLARNLGIPNVVIARERLPELVEHRDRSVVIAASSGGVVQIAEDGPEWDRILGRGVAVAPAAIVVDLGKLELLRTDFISTDDLHAADSGRSVGPKAAQVGELTHRFPGMVSRGLAVPFGIYRAFLGQPVRAGGPPMFEWMRDQYAQMAVQRWLDPAGHEVRVREFLAFVRNWIATQPLEAAQRERLFDAMQDRFGMSGTYGVFVRSDTNVEDLPGFTGAGLNLTVANVVRFDEVLVALRAVWASPFTERAFGWRQDLMDQPEHVYVSVLLHQAVHNEKSGVLVTADIDSGDRSILTVATSPGVSGSVDSEAAETLRVNLDSGATQLLASGTARLKRELPVEGGARMVPSIAPEVVLQPDEIAQLVAFARALPAHYPELHDGDGATAPADVEFGFVAGRLRLFQIRPFLQNRAAMRQQYLAGLDEGLRRNADLAVDLRLVPPS